MTTSLLDVNVLIALAWPNHSLHARARAWFTGEREGRWATCPTTQSGFVRLSSNPAVTGADISPARAVKLLQAAIAREDHDFWPEESPVPEVLAPFGNSLAGHRQITDAYLLGLAIRNEGSLATLDGRLASLLPRRSAHRQALTVLEV